MNWRTYGVLVVALLVVAAASRISVADEGAGTSLRVDDLRCEYLVNPLGIDARAGPVKLEAGRFASRSTESGTVGLPGCGGAVGGIASRRSRDTLG